MPCYVIIIDINLTEPTLLTSIYTHVGLCLWRPLCNNLDEAIKLTPSTPCGGAASLLGRTRQDKDLVSEALNEDNQ